MATSFFATKISANLARTPEGFLLARGVTIARTGFQRYELHELPQDRVEELGITGNGYVDVYRDAKQVFAPSTIASGEGKTITLFHPPDFVDPDNYRTYARGHMQNVHKGTEALESGDWPLVADLLITDADAIAAVDNGQRELSAGYSYDLDKAGDLLVQNNIILNHLAIVPNGRAGSEARIYDAAAPALALPDFGHVDQTATQPTKPDVRPSIKKGAIRMKNPLAFLIGRGLKAMAADEGVSPEDLTEAARAAHRATDSEGESEEDKEKKKKEKEAEDAKRMKDSAEEEAKKKAAKDAESEGWKKRATDAEEENKKFKKESEDRKAKDAEAEGKEQHFQPCAVKDCGARDCRMHDALGGILKAHPESEDADVQELGNILQQFMAEEANEPEHQGEVEPGDSAADVIEPIKEVERAEGVRASDAAANDAEEVAFLKRIRPIVARSNDKALIADFNQRSAKFHRKSRASVGTYAGAAAASGRGRDVRITEEDKYAKLQAGYDARRAGKKITEEMN
jgi:hypothetical protein